MTQRIGFLLCLLALPLSAETPAALSIRMHTTATSARPNSIFTYRLSVVNSGPSAANVVVTDVLPADLLFDAISPSFFTCTTPPVGMNGTVTCTGARQSDLMFLRVRVAPGAKPGVVTNRATVRSSAPDVSDATAVAEPVSILAPAGVERRVDPVAAPPWSSQFAPQVATTRQNALAVWGESYVSFAPPETNVSIRGALFRPDAEERTLISFAAPEFGTGFSYPVVAASDDRYLVVWRELRSSQGRILARRLNADGSFIDTQPLVLDTGNAVVSCCSTDVATDIGSPRPSVASNGRDFYVAWVSANYNVRGIAVPAEGPLIGEPWLVSREGDVLSRGHYDVAVVWTSAMYIVTWLDRVLQVEPATQVLRYARVKPDGVLFDTGLSKTIAGPDIRSMTATSFADGAVITLEYAQSGTQEAPQHCIGVIRLKPSGEPDAVRVLRCDDERISADPALHPTMFPVAGGFLLVHPGRRYPPPFSAIPIRTYSADGALSQLSDPTLLGILGWEISVANWQGQALLVYNHTDGDVPGAIVPRVFTFLIQDNRRVRAVRH